jgi:hypothetical protein
LLDPVVVDPRFAAAMEEVGEHTIFQMDAGSSAGDEQAQLSVFRCSERRRL